MIFEDFIGDAVAAERICKIVNGLWDGTVRLAKEPKYGELVCYIGFEDYDGLYFIGDEDRVLSPEEVKMNYDVFTIADMILNAIIELDDDEYTYYCDALGF